MRRALLADVSHELRTPLTTIRGYLDTLLAPSRTWSPQRHSTTSRLCRKRRGVWNGLSVTCWISPRSRHPATL